MQKKGIKKKQKAERAAQSKVKAARLAKLREPRGFRKIHFGTEVYLWRYHGNVVEIRTPHQQKWIVPIWKIQGHTSQAEWEKNHENDYSDDGDWAYWVQPRLVREHIDAQRKLC